MNILTSPKVELVAATEFRGHTAYAIPLDGDDATRTCSFAAKGCYDSFGVDGRANALNQQQIISSRHGSVLEHVSATLFIEGITRALSLELNRHRHLAISQRSTRYTAEEDCAIVLEPYYAELYDRMQKEPASMSPIERALITGHIQLAKLSVSRYKSEVDLLLRLNPRELRRNRAQEVGAGQGAQHLTPCARNPRHVDRQPSSVAQLHRAAYRSVCRSRDSPAGGRSSARADWLGTALLCRLHVRAGRWFPRVHHGIPEDMRLWRWLMKRYNERRRAH